MNEQEYAALARELMKKYMGCSPEEYQQEKRAQKEREEAENQSVRRFVFEQEIIKTSDDYKKRAAHVIGDDPLNGAGLTLGRYIRAIAGAKREGIRPQDWVLKVWGDKWLADDIDRAEKRTLTTDVETAGGFIVPEEYRNSMIELLRNKTIVRRSGIPVVPMRRGSMTLPKQTGAATASYVGEARRIDPSEPTFGQIQLLARKLAGLVPVSNDLLRESDPSADMIIRDDLARVMALTEDTNLLRGAGTAFTPQGLRFQIDSANVAASAGTTLDQKTQDLFDAILRVQQDNVDLSSPVWYLSVRTASGLRRQRDANGNFVFKAEMDSGRLLGFPFFESNQVPSNLGGGSDSEIYFVETSQCLIGDTMELELVVEPNGTYTNASGTVISGLSHDLTMVRAIKKHDIAMRHTQAGAVVSGVAY
jgi:HK97 family phage major capsid protein